mmetsp:Transcript_33728/g.104419  ORF Transcript_33728/g.104419 Transcript_33728/m.104419 type:complete len:80 (-) Transcript_33728:355-594(-)
MLAALHEFRPVTIARFFFLRILAVLHSLGKSCAHLGQQVLCVMSLAEDPTLPLDYVLQDGLGFEYVVAGVLGVETEGAS